MAKRQTGKRRGWKRSLRGGIVLVVLIPLWLLFAPVPLGGSTSYVTTSGISMAPLLHGGDLAIVRETPEYLVGDIVAYRNREIEQVVLHRIVALDGDRYVFQGDNNEFLDSYHPDRGDVVGKLWLHVPSAGRLLAWVGTSRNAVVLGGILGLFAVGGFSGVRARRRRRRRGHEGGAPRARTPGLVPSRETLPGLSARKAIAVFLTSTVALVALAALAFSRPLDTSSSTNISYEQHGAFSYSARGLPGPVYGGEALSTGDPVFLRLVRQVRVSFAYGLEAEASHATSGTIGLAAVLTDTTGWTHTIGIQQPTVFQGDEATASGAIDLVSLQRLITGVQKQTEIPQSQYSLTLTADVQVAGSVAGKPMTDSFSPALGFILDPNLLRLEPPRTGTTGEPPADALAPSREGSVSVPGTEEARLTVQGHSLSVGTVRRIAGWGGAASFAALSIAAALAFVRRPKEEPDRIRAKYGNRLILIDATEEIAGATVDVASMKALVMVAEGYDGKILHQDRGGVHTYMVEGEVVMYRYRSPRVGIARPRAGSDERDALASVASAPEPTALRTGEGDHPCPAQEAGA